MGLKQYIVKKTAYALLSLLAMTVLCFVIFQILPLLTSCPGTIQSQCIQLLYIPRFPSGGPSYYGRVQSLIQTWGLFQPTPVRLLIYMRNMLTFNFGYNTGALNPSQGLPLPVLNTIEQRLPFTALLLGSSTIAAMFIGTGLATVVAAGRGRIMDVSLQAVSLLVLSLPVFFLGALIELGEWILMPPHPIGPSCCYLAPRFVLDAGLLKALLLPFATLTLVGSSFVFLIQHRLDLHSSGQEHLLLARTRGLPDSETLLRQTLRNTGLPLARTFVVSMGVMVSAAVVIETVFNWPGLGQAIMMGELYSDLPLEQAIFFVLAAIMIIAKHLFDIVGGLSDPRIAVSGS